MILEEVLCSLRDRFMDTGYFNVFYEYCERVQRGKIIEPQYYQKGGQYKPVMDFDVNGAGYIRKNGKTQMRFNSQYPQITSCDDDSIIDLSYPMRIVMGVPKNKLQDSAYSDDLLFSELISILGGSFSATNVIDTSVSILNYDTDSLTIWSEEVSGIDYQMNFKLTYLAIDINITFTLKQSCMAQACGYGY